MARITICPPQPNPKHTHQMKGKKSKTFKRSCPPNKMGGDPVLTSTIKQGSSKRTKEEASRLLAEALRAL